MGITEGTVDVALNRNAFWGTAQRIADFDRGMQSGISVFAAGESCPISLRLFHKKAIIGIGTVQPAFNETGNNN